MPRGRAVTITVEDTPALKQWAPRNTLDPATTSANSRKKAWWLCEAGHEWEADIKNRAMAGTGCPYCSGRRAVAGVSDLKTLHPELWEELSEANTEPLDEVSPYSNKKLLWACPKGHDFLAPVGRRVRGSGCTYCANSRVLVGFNDLPTTHPHLLESWDFERNTVAPETVLVKTKTKFWWLCAEGHSWESAGGHRARGQGCPYCNKGTLLPGFNDLATARPDIAEEWDYERNELRPDEVGKGSGLRVWWLCKEAGHSWEATLANRVNHESGCPSCSRRVSTGELEVRDFLEELLGTEAVASSRSVIAPYELDIYFPNQGVAVEFNGTFWHSDAQVRKTHDISAMDYHSMKLRLCEERGITLLFVWQEDWDKLREGIKAALRRFFAVGELDSTLIQRLNSRGDNG